MRPRHTLLAVVTALALCACSSATGAADPASGSAGPSGSPTPAPTPAPTQTAPGEGGVPVPDEAPTGAAGGDAQTPAAPSETLVPQLTFVGAGVEDGSIEVSGVVPGVVEDDGTCVFRFTSGSRTAVETTTHGIADASSTSCGTAVLQPERLAAGTWDVTLTYRGAAGSGTSVATSVAVP